MSGGRGVGFDTARSETPFGFTPATQLELLIQPPLVLLKPTVAAAAKRSRASFEFSLPMF